MAIPASWQTQLHPRRGGLVQPHPPANLEPLRKTIDSAFGEPLAHTLEGPWDPEQARRLFQRLLSRKRRQWESSVAATALIELLLATHGPTAAMSVWQENRNWGYRSLVLRRLDAVQSMRSAIAACSDEEYARAVDFATDWRNRLQADPSQEVSWINVEAATAYLFPTQSWWQGPGMRVNLHLSCVEDPDQLEAFAKQHGLPDDWGNDLSVARSLLAEHGSAVLDFVAAGCLDDTDTDTVKAGAAMLAELSGVGPASALLQRRKNRHVRAVLPALAARHPQGCIQAGLQLNSTDSAFQRTLQGWIVENRAAAEAVRPRLTSAEVALLDRLLQAHDDQGPEAALDTLPALFTDPPWSRTPGKAPKAMKVAAILPEASIVLSDAQQAEAQAAQAHVEARREDIGDIQYHWHGDAIQLIALALTQPDQARKLAKNSYWEDDYDDFFLGAAVTLPLELASELAVAVLGGKATSTHVYAYATPHIARWMLDGLVKKSVRDRSLAWMAAQPEYATRAWLPTVLGRSSKKQAAVRAALIELLQAQPERVHRAIAAYPQEVRTAFLAQVEVDPLLKLPSKLPPSDFVVLGTLPAARLREGGARLPPAAMDCVLKCLSLSGGPAAYAGLAQIQALVTPESLAAGANALFEQWLEAGAPSKSDWALTMLAHVGDDQTARVLAPLVRRWPGESQHQRAVKGLDVLLGIGSEVALMHLNGISQKVKFKGIKSAARERIDTLAVQLGLTGEQLADRLVPSLGLDEEGALLLDYGPRHFTVHFDEALRPVVRDDTGKLRKSLPKPGARDEADKAVPAEARFKELKKDVRALAAIQLKRFEVAMITGRRWSADSFRTHLVAHPLVCHLVRRLIWGIYEGNTLLRSFRVADDNTFADAEDEELSLPEGLVVGIAHPIDLDPDTRAAWGEVLADYELLQPFTQLGRPTFSAEAAELAQTKLIRNPKQRVAVRRVLGLTSRGWERGEALDGGVVHWLSMPLPGGQREVRLNLGGAGLWMGMVHEQPEDPTIESVTVNERTDDGYEAKIPLSEVPPALMSEVLAAIHQLQATE